MTMPDPDPAETTGLASGGGVDPGDTPPGEASTVGPTQSQPMPGRAAGPIVLGLVGLVVLLVALFLVGRIFSFF